MRNNFCGRGESLAEPSLFRDLNVKQSDVPEKWRAKALSEVDPASIDKVCNTILQPQYSTYPDNNPAPLVTWLFLPRLRFLFP